MMQRVRGALGWSLAGIALWWIGRSLVRQARRYELAGRRVLVSGGSRGLGCCCGESAEQRRRSGGSAAAADAQQA